MQAVSLAETKERVISNQSCIAYIIGQTDMEYINIIIDRVDSTNIFNMVESRPTDLSHLHTPVDQDLIDEYLGELHRLSKIANTYQIRDPAAPGELTAALRNAGETFYRQFFPVVLQEYLTQVRAAFLCFHVDPELRHIPFELLHDGQGFLADRMFMGKHSGTSARQSDNSERERLRVLIVADPAENLEWARLEGEQLYENLIAEVSPDRINLEYLAGRRVTKLKLLNAIQNHDIIHYSGHFHMDTTRPQESGWLLKDNRILRTREIARAGRAPLLVFSNSCLSAAIAEGQNENHIHDLAGAFLFAGIGNYIGTNWEIKDNHHSADFAMHFYRSIFEEKTVGEALYDARRFARVHYPPSDITWANYVLHGNPDTRIYRQAGHVTFDASRSQNHAFKIVDAYPLPIARNYEAYQVHALEAEGYPHNVAIPLRSLCKLFENTLLTVGAIVQGNFQYYELKALRYKEQNMDLREWTDLIYECIDVLRTLQRELVVQRLLESLLLHKDKIYRMLDLLTELEEENFKGDELETYHISLQFQLDNLLSDLAVLGRGQIVYVSPELEEILLLNGNQIRSISLEQFTSGRRGLRSQIEAERGHCCYFDRTVAVLFSLQPFLQYDQQSGEIFFASVQRSEFRVG